MTVRLAALVAHCGGTLTRDADIELSGFAPLERAQTEHLAFVSDPKKLGAACATRAGVLIARPDWADRLASFPGVLWLHPNPYLAFARALQYIVAQGEAAPVPGVHPSSIVDPAATVAADASVGPLCVIGAGTAIGAGACIGPGCMIGSNVTIGPGTVLHARVTIYDDCRLGAECVVHAGAVIGADGFGYARDGSCWVKIPQIGGVRIGDRVDIGANTTIDRGALDDTVIEDGVKLDNQIQVAHNVSIGEDSALAACVGIAGSAKIGKRCTFGGAAMINGHIEIADDVYITAATMVPNSIPEPGRYTGYFPIDEHRAWERNAVVVRRITDLRARVRALEAVLGASPLSQESDPS